MKSLNLQEILSEASRARDEYENYLRELVEFPSISNDPERKEDISRCASRAAELIRQFGGEASILHSQNGAPFVHAVIPSKGKTANLVLRLFCTAINKGINERNQIQAGA